jgi:hypothetical protein
MRKLIKLGIERVIPDVPYKVCLNNNGLLQCVDADYDISGIKIINPEKHIIDKITINIGCKPTLIYEGDEINNIILPEGGILFSKALHTNIAIYIHFNKKYVKSKCDKMIVYKYREIEEETDKLVRLRDPDTNQIHSGYLIAKRKERLDEKEEIIGPDAPLKLPHIEFTVSLCKKKSENRILTPFWHKCYIDPTIESEEYINNLIIDRGLYTDDPGQLQECLSEKKPFIGKVRNSLVYISNICGTLYPILDNNAKRSPFRPPQN